MKRIITTFVLLITFTSFIFGGVVYSIPLQGKELPIGNLLEWNTANEVDSKIFLVQRSFDGSEYEDIGIVDALGLSDEDVPYQFLDMNINEKKAFYRLKEIDIEDVSSYSQIININRKKLNNFRLISFSMLEVGNEFRVTVDALKEGTLTCEVSDLLDNKINTETFDMKNGARNLKFDMKDLPSGRYKISFSMNDEKESLIFLKLEDELNKKTNVASR